MAVVIELVLQKSVSPNKVKELFVDFLKLAPPIFKSFKIRYVPEKRTTKRLRKLDHFDESSRDFGCTTCFMDEEVSSVFSERDFSLKTVTASLDDSYHTDLHANKTCYLDCEYNASKTSKTMDKSGTFPQKELSWEIAPLITSYRKRKSDDISCCVAKNELQTASNNISNMNREVSLTNHSVALSNNSDSFHSRKDFQMLSTIKMEQAMSTINERSEGDIMSRMECEEELEVRSPNPIVGPSLTPNFQPSNLVDAVLAAANRGDLAIDENYGDDNYENGEMNLQMLPAFRQKQKITSLSELVEDDIMSNEALDNTSFDRSSLCELEEERVELEDEEPLPKPESAIRTNAINLDNLVEVLAAAKRGDLTIDEGMADASFFTADFVDEPMVAENELTQEYDFAFEMLKLENDGGTYRRRILWKNIKCKLCMKSKFCKLEEAITHLHVKHCGPSTPKIYKCRLCSATSFYKRNLLKEHLQKKHRLQYRRITSSSTIEEKWHPITLMRTLEAGKEAFPNIIRIIERYLVWVVKSGKFDMIAYKEYSG